MRTGQLDGAVAGVVLVGVVADWAFELVGFEVFDGDVGEGV